MYGLDVVAPQHWGEMPDLVISGPNPGLNQGGFAASGSGTINAALLAINRGIPAIATSYTISIPPQVHSYKQLSTGDLAYQVADRIVVLLQHLQSEQGSAQQLLPLGVGLNVNIPVLNSGKPSTVFQFARMGLASKHASVFYADLSNSPLAKAAGINSHLPGISLVTPQMPVPPGVVLPKDKSPLSEANENAKGEISVSVIEGLPQARRSNEDAVRIRLHSLFSNQ